MSDDGPQLTEEQVRQGFEEIYGVTIEEVIEVLQQSLEEDHQLRKRLNEAGNDLEAAEFTEEEKESMQDIQNYVDERNES